MIRKYLEKNQIVVLSVSAGAAVFAICAYVLYMSFNRPDVGFVEVAAMILVGFAAFIILMNVLSFGATYLKIIDKTQPFGLPEGSVRAILTLAFIVLVGVLAAYLVTNSDGRTQFSAKPPICILQKASRVDAQSAVKSFDSDVGLASMARHFDCSQPNAETSGSKAPVATAPGASPAPQTPDDTYDVAFYPRVDHRLSDDISKQILTMLSTVLAAMIGFYFGSRTGGTGTGPAEPDDHYKMPALKTLKATAIDLLGKSTDPATNTTLTALLAELNTMEATLGGLNTRYQTSDQLASEAEADKKIKADLDARADAIGKQLDDLKATPTPPVGTTGPIAATGPSGPSGPTGPSGPSGPTGPSGPSGPTGDGPIDGVNGATGPCGATGS